MPCDFVAEVSSNHHRDLERSLAFVAAAAAMGCTAVKFQLFRIDELFAPEILAARPELRRRRAWELPPEQLPLLARAAHERGLQFSCTPFYLEAVTQLAPHVDFYKIASYELLWDELLAATARTGRPVVLSTGMATLDEVDHAVAVLRRNGCRDLRLLHCVSGYPTPLEQCNLAVIDTLRERYGCGVGWSDHSVRPEVVQRAVLRWGASMVEFHLDLDGQGAEYATGHCWLPEQMAPVIQGLRAGTAADGSGDKRPVAAELADRDWRADPGDGLRPLRALRRGTGS